MTKRTRQKPGDAHYVNNKEFTLALDEYSQSYKKAIQAGEETPIMSNYLGECVMKMANRLALSPKFRNYTYRDEMIQDAILGAVKYMHRFDGDRFNNGFAYVTQILFSHMIQTIKKEKKKYELNMRMIQQAEIAAMSDPELGYDIANEHARAIADQKLGEIEAGKMKDGKKGGFVLRSGFTKEERAKYKGTPVDRNK